MLIKSKKYKKRNEFKMDKSRGRTHLDRILFTTAYKGEDLKNWPKRNKLLKAARNTLKKYE